MLIPSWAKSAAGVVLAVAAIATTSYCAGRDAGKHAANAVAMKASQHRFDSVAALVTRDHAEKDSLHTANAALAAQVDSLSHRVTIVGPGVIRIATGESRASVPLFTDSGGMAVPPPAQPPVVTVTVPTVVTTFMQAQAKEIAGLTAEVAVADSGWTHEHALRLERERELSIVKSQHSRFGLKTGIALGILGTVGAVYLAGRLD